jgi:hypothetical protein
MALQYHARSLAQLRSNAQGRDCLNLNLLRSIQKCGHHHRIGSCQSETTRRGRQPKLSSADNLSGESLNRTNCPPRSAMRPRAFRVYTHFPEVSGTDRNPNLLLGIQVIEPAEPISRAHRNGPRKIDGRMRDQVVPAALASDAFSSPRTRMERACTVPRASRQVARRFSVAIDSLPADSRDLLQVRRAVDYKRPAAMRGEQSQSLKGRD